jgi:hypothetical protein
MTQLYPTSKRGWSAKSYCHNSRSSMQAMWMHNGTVTSQTRFNVDLVGPTRGDHKWQSRKPTGFDASHFQIDWDKQQATCPQGQVSMGWTEAYDGDRAVVKVKFSFAKCSRCSCRQLCTRSRRRTLTLRPRGSVRSSTGCTPTGEERSIY